jgi:hypothetical protein
MLPLSPLQEELQHGAHRAMREAGAEADVNEQLVTNEMSADALV